MLAGTQFRHKPGWAFAPTVRYTAPPRITKVSARMAVANEQAAQTLLAPDEPAPCDIIEAQTDRPLLLACDHASRRIPRSLGDLGIPQDFLDTHIAWDIGAGAVTRLLCERLGCGAVLGNFSRLVVDLNRELEDSTAFPAISDGVLVPGNLSLTVEARANRARSVFKPYHEALWRLTQSLSSADQRPVMIGIHSFTPYLHGLFRPWEIGVLWEKDARLPLPLMAALREGGVHVGDNMPYSGRHPADFTIDHHAEPAGLAHAGIEIRQDLICDPDGQGRWAEKIAAALDLVLKREDLYRPKTG